uniref:CID domain-containing protein n=3 Tax=Manihot esculenta TaxID=3983 RepID=A0A2C9W163_MANES
MAPGRKKGANKVKANSELTLGDLVLAKVKGFPAWPAKISRPEDWERVPDPKKCFVQFFGTEEIAFVAPADIQIFTSELMSKLLARCQGKSRYFAQAVKEISAAFQQLQKEKSSSLQGTDRSEPGCEGASVDRITDDIELELNGGMGTSESKIETWDDEGDFDSKLKHCSHRQGQTEYEDIKPSISSDANDASSLVMSSEKKAEISNGEPQLVLSNIKDEESGDVHGNVSCTKKPGNAERAGMNIHKFKSMANETKRKHEDATGGNKKDSSGVYVLSNNVKKLKDREEEKNASGGTVTGFSPDALVSDSEAVKSDSEIRTGIKPKQLQKGKNSCIVPDSMHENVSNCMGEVSDKKKRAQSGLGKTSETSHPAKKTKCLHVGDAAAKASLTKNTKNDSPSSNAVKHSTSHDKREILLALRAQTGKGKTDGFSQAARNKSNISSQTGKAKSAVSIQTGKGKSTISSDEAVLPVSKCHRRAMEAMSDSVFFNSNDKTDKDCGELKIASNNVSVLVNQLPKRRRAVCLYDDDDDEEEDPKTPIHGGSSKSIRVPSLVFGTSIRTDSHIGSSVNHQHGGSIDVLSSVDDSTRFERSSSKESFSQVHVESLSPFRSKSVKLPDTLDFFSPVKLAGEQLLSKDAKLILNSPKKSPHLPVTRPPLEQHEATKPLFKASNGCPMKKAQSVSTKSGLVSDSLNTSQNHVVGQRNRQGISGERLKSTPKGQMGDPAVLMEPSTEQEVVTEDGSSSLVDSKTPDSVMSMKHLIAAAQAKRREAHSQHFPLGNPYSSFISINDSQGRSPSPSSFQPFLSGTSTVLHTDLHGFQQHVVSSSAHDHQSASCNQVDTEDLEEQRVSSGHRAIGGSLSGGTEAAVARDAFEGMIETLSRTKESIGRATRLAIDCAKYGISNEVVELLIRKLESESSFHRKVDLFFLVDSITQCSHNQKGIAGASYVPTVQAALPRLLSAAAPPGNGARENRRQCLKVLRLWLERKILPESVLRQYMDDIGISNDDSSAGVTLRRPSRAERAVDDPIREMEGMLVDEYGSNATFQLPGFLSSSVFEEEDEEDDLPGSSLKEGACVSTLADTTRTLGDKETFNITPNDRPVCSSRESSGYNPSRQLEYGHNDLYLNPQASQQNPHFQPGNASFTHRSLHSTLPQNVCGQFSFAKPAIQQHPQHSFPHPYPVPSHPDGRRRFVGDDIWRLPSSEFNTDNQHGTWMSGRTPAHPGPFGHEGMHLLACVDLCKH